MTDQGESADPDPTTASTSGPGAHVVPIALYIVAALFFAKGMFLLALTATSVAQIENLTLDFVLQGLIPSLVAPSIFLALGWGLAHFGDGSRLWASFFLICGIVIRLVGLALVALFLADHLNGNVTGKSADELRRSGSWSTWHFGDVLRLKSSASPHVGWYFVKGNKTRNLTPVDTIVTSAILLSGVALNFWQHRVLRRPQISRLFESGERADLIGQMSLVRFLLMTTVFLSIYLAIWKAGYFI
jgi:hypothetical protein